MGKIDKKSKIKILLICFVWVIVLLLLFSNLELFRLLLKGDVKSVRAALTGNLPFAYFFMFIIMIIQNSFTVIPLILPITLNFILFGFVEGFLWSWMTSVLAAALIFIFVRYVFQDNLIKKFNSEMVAKVEQEGFVYVFQGRIFPFVPTSVVNILAGISTIHFKQFIFGTIYGNFIYFFILSLIPAGIISTNINIDILVLTIFISISIFYGISKFLKKKRRKLNE